MFTSATSISILQNDQGKFPNYDIPTWTRCSCSNAERVIYLRTHTVVNSATRNPRVFQVPNLYTALRCIFFFLNYVVPLCPSRKHLKLCLCHSNRHCKLLFSGGTLYRTVIHNLMTRNQLKTRFLFPSRRIRPAEEFYTLQPNF